MKKKMKLSKNTFPAGNKKFNSRRFTIYKSRSIQSNNQKKFKLPPIDLLKYHQGRKGRYK